MSIVSTRLSSEQIIDRIKRRVTKQHPNAYHIYVGDYTLYNKVNYGFVNVYVKAKAMFTIDGSVEEQMCEVDFGIE